MIRTSRVFFFGKNIWEAPVLTQRMTPLPKQVFVKFSIADDEKATKPAVLDPSKIPKLQQSPNDLKFELLRQILNASSSAQRVAGSMRSYSVLNDFLIDLPSLKPPEIIKVLKLLSETNNRPIDSIKALCTLLNSNKEWSYTVGDCCDLLYSLTRLSYRDQEVVAMVAENLKKYTDFQSPKTASLILFSLGDLKFRDCELLDKLIKYVLLNAEHIKVSLHCLRTVSLLNYQPPEVDELITFLSHFSEIDFIQSTDYVNFVWSTIMLNKQHLLTSEQISSVLSEEFIARLLQSAVHPSVKWKLLNINGAVKQMKDYKGPILNHDSRLKIMSLSLPKQKSAFLESVMDVLSYIVPQAANLKPLVNLGAGFYLDFEFNIESKTQEKESPKIGVLLLNYNDICSDGTLSGISAFKVNILNNLDYKVVLLKYTEYCSSDPLSKKIELLRSKIQEVVGQDVKLGNLYSKD